MAGELSNKGSILAPPLSNEEEEEEGALTSTRYSRDVLPEERKLPTWSSYCFRQPLDSSSSSSTVSSSGSSLSSPVESELGSTESESDQDDEYIAELTRQMALYMLQDDDITRYEKSLDLDGSQQPAVCSSQEDIKLMVDKFQNLKINGDKFKFQNRDSHLTATLSPTSVLAKPRNPSGLYADFHSKQALIDEQIRAIKLNKFKEEQVARQKQEDSLHWKSNSYGYKQMEPNNQIRQVQRKGRGYGTGANYGGDGQNASWANNNRRNQQRTGSETMRAVFLGEPGSRSGSSGTGVFLPRGIGNTSEVPRKKPGCSTVLIPARVVQALKLHFDKVGVPSRSSAAVSLLQNVDGVIGDVSYGLQLQEKGQSPTVPAIDPHNPEMCLPQEWTY